MDNLKFTIANNIILLRRKHSMTQMELAERLNYSDKAVSKWERAASVPDIAVLKQIAEIFSVTVDYLLTEDHGDGAELSDSAGIRDRLQRNHVIITAICVVLVWLVATLAFVLVRLFSHTPYWDWMPFVFAVPVSCIVLLVFNSVWFNPRRNFTIISLLMWSVLSVVYIICLLFDYNFWLLFIIGIPAQIIILLWSGIRIRSKSDAASPPQP